MNKSYETGVAKVGIDLLKWRIIIVVRPTRVAIINFQIFQVSIMSKRLDIQKVTKYSPSPQIRVARSDRHVIL